MLAPLPLTFLHIVFRALSTVLLDLVPGKLLAPLPLTLAQLVLGALGSVLLYLLPGELLAPLPLILAQLVFGALGALLQTLLRASFALLSTPEESVSTLPTTSVGAPGEVGASRYDRPRSMIFFSSVFFCRRRLCTLSLYLLSSLW